MRPTRRFWATALAGLFALAAVVLLDEPAYLLVAIGIAAWLVATQVRFLHALETLHTQATITQTVAPQRLAEDEPVQVTISIDTPNVTADIDELTVAADLPVAVRDLDGATTAQPEIGTTDALTFTVTIPIAGRHTFDPPILEVTSPFGLFTETIETASDADVTVEPRRPRDIHVGEGGDRVAIAAGEHAATHGRQSTRPAEIREYQAGDPADRIDWKATARLNEPFVREFEARGERSTILIVDHREASGTGRDGETALDYAREVALAVADDAAQNDDPLGLHAVGDAGLSVSHQPTADRNQYQRVRTALHDLDPTHHDTTIHRHTGPGDAYRRANRLDGDEAFARTLRPFFQDGAYVERLRDDPLFETLQHRVTDIAGSPWIVLFTTDANRAEVRETVKLARRGNRQVTVFLTPTALYAERGLTDVEDAYQQYADFEDFRRDLARLDGVSAFEIAPRDRITSILGESARTAGGAYT